jgi:hypothetical protein
MVHFSVSRADLALFDIPAISTMPEELLALNRRSFLRWAEPRPIIILNSQKDSTDGVAVYTRRASGPHRRRASQAPG